MSNVLKIDELLIGDHFYLRPEDDCFYHMEYASRMGYTHSNANNLIHNFKKPVSYKNQPPWRYKISAIKEIGNLYKSSLSGIIDLTQVSLVPIPPSKVSADPEYDNRMLQMIHHWTDGQPHVDIRELIKMKVSIEAVHEGDNRLSPEELMRLMSIDSELIDGVRNEIILLDDVLTTGAHFVACKNILEEYFPAARIRGIFIARTIWIRPTPEDDFDIDF